MASGLRNIKIRFIGDSKNLDGEAKKGSAAVAKFAATVARVAGGLGEKISSGISGAVEAMPPMGKLVAGVLAAGLTAALAPAIGAAISAALLLAVGGGVLAAGIAAVAKTPRVSAAFGKLKDSLFDRDTTEIESKIAAAQERFLKAQALGSKKGMQSAKYDIQQAKKELESALDFNKANKSFRDMFTPFIAPLERLAGSLTTAFEKAKPAIERMAAALTPVIDQLAGGALEGFVTNILPGIEKAVAASVPLFLTLSDKLPGLATSISIFFEKIAGSGPDANEFWGDMLDAIGWIIEALGTVIGWLASFYSAVKDQLIAAKLEWVRFKIALIAQFGAILDAAYASMSWIPGLGGKLAAAKEKFAQFARDANAQLATIRSQYEIYIIANFQTRGFKGPSPNQYTGRAIGGPVRAGSTYLVGEHGPELLHMGGNGWVGTNRELREAADGGTTEIHVHLADDVTRVIRMNNRDLKRRTRARNAAVPA